MTLFLMIIGYSICFGVLASLLWSIARPSRRIWPPKACNQATLIFVWMPTITLFGVIVSLGILGWNDMGLPEIVRFYIGVPLIAIGHLAVWREVIKFGLNQTSGSVGILKTNGLYRYSRNPQYVADIVMIIGWILLSASTMVVLVSLFAIVLLLIAPIAEETWLMDQYGAQYKQYTSEVRRYLGRY